MTCSQRPFDRRERIIARGADLLDLGAREHAVLPFRQRGYTPIHETPVGAASTGRARARS